MIELSWDEFKKTYEPIKQTERKGIERYLLPAFENIDFEVKGNIINRQTLTNRPNFTKALNVYEMYVWTLKDNDTLVSGRKIVNAKGYILCVKNHNIDDEISVNIYKKNNDE